MHGYLDQCDSASKFIVKCAIIYLLHSTAAELLAEQLAALLKVHP